MSLVFRIGGANHVRLELDFAVLFRTFVDDHVIMNSIRSIRKALMIPSSEPAPTIKKTAEYDKGLKHINRCYYEFMDTEQYILDIYILLTRNKSEAYDDNKGVMAFKIDVEIARYVGDDKIIDDSGNLSREADKLNDACEKRRHLEGSLGENVTMSLPEVTYWTRPTFYTPPRNQK
ncbi:hypothetical protein HPULCUR_006129 [Helicostylum pulchrum]|uniref:Uncharacterized protein n=1 Tax=Helicostylum pulchrum TaxID=562976 RepID=A0ABP9Y296_9FUNG